MKRILFVAAVLLALFAGSLDSTSVVVVAPVAVAQNLEKALAASPDLLWCEGAYRSDVGSNFGGCPSIGTSGAVVGPPVRKTLTGSIPEAGGGDGGGSAGGGDGGSGSGGGSGGSGAGSGTK